MKITVTALAFLLAAFNGVLAQSDIKYADPSCEFGPDGPETVQLSRQVCTSMGGNFCQKTNEESPRFRCIVPQAKRSAFEKFCKVKKGTVRKNDEDVDYAAATANCVIVPPF